MKRNMEFFKHRAHCVIGFSDQIPVWLKLGRDKQVYAAFEEKKWYKKWYKKKTEDFEALPRTVFSCTEGISHEHMRGKGAVDGS